MSEYTELSLDADSPKETLAILRYILESEEGAPAPLLLDEPAGKPLGFYRWQRSKWPTPIHMRRRPADGEGAFGTTALPYPSDVPHDVDKIDQAALAVLYISRHNNYGA